MVSCPEDVVPDRTDAPTSEPEIFVASDIGEDLLATAYLRMKVEGIIETYYHVQVPPLSEFLSYHNGQDRGYHYLGAFLRPTVGQPAEFIGMGWLWNVMGKPGSRKGEVGMMFFRKWQVHRIPIKAMRLMLDYCFDVAKCDIVVGTTPIKNRAALVFDKRLGFTQLPPIPNFTMFQGEPCDAVISYLTAKQWRQ